MILRMTIKTALLFLFLLFASLSAKVEVGIDLLFSHEYVHLLKGKNVGLVTNQTGVNHRLELSSDLLKSQAKIYGYTLTALFTPEHGLKGQKHAAEKIEYSLNSFSVPVYSLHGKTRRPTPEMLKNINLLIFDIQDIGSRSYTYLSTLCYVMEEAAKLKIPLIVLDRPNPINGITVDGPLLDDKWRSFIGYINVPYCHGMTLGELARYFNDVYQVGCSLTVVPMKGWKREMSFVDTGLPWIPTSPNIPEPTTPLFYPMTGILGEGQIANIGIGFTLPFKIVGAPWIHAEKFAATLNAQKFPGVYFQPFYYKPFYGRFINQECEGVLIIITDSKKYLPVTTQYLILGILKNLYPDFFWKDFPTKQSLIEMFNKANGTAEIYRILEEETYSVWKLRDFQKKERIEFSEKRKKYLLY